MTSYQFACLVCPRKPDGENATHTRPEYLGRGATTRRHWVLTNIIDQRALDDMWPTLTKGERLMVVIRAEDGGPRSWLRDLVEADGAIRDFSFAYSMTARVPTPDDHEVMW
ncbi:MAG TPA: hypothetical protein VJ850_09035 [Candidatus Limnocylindrales bacterium]|nr:hypothetical protein [Candidatus Limnocylindrales bacterium]